MLGTEEYCIPTYQVCKSIYEIDFDKLIGKRTVIKPRSMKDSQGVMIQRKKLKKTDIPEIIETSKNNQYLQNTRIVVEKYIGDQEIKRIFKEIMNFGVLMENRHLF